MSVVKGPFFFAASQIVREIDGNFVDITPRPADVLRTWVEAAERLTTAIIASRFVDAPVRVAGHGDQLAVMAISTAIDGLSKTIGPGFKPGERWQYASVDFTANVILHQLVDGLAELRKWLEEANVNRLFETCPSLPKSLFEPFHQATISLRELLTTEEVIANRKASVVEPVEPQAEMLASGNGATGKQPHAARVETVNAPPVNGRRDELLLLLSGLDESGIPLIELPDKLQEPDLLNVLHADNKLIEFVRRKHCHVFPTGKSELRLEDGWEVTNNVIYSDHGLASDVLKSALADDVETPEIRVRVRLTKVGRIEVSRIRLRNSTTLGEFANTKLATPVEPQAVTTLPLMLFGWRQILVAIGRPNNEEEKERVKRLNARENGPIRQEKGRGKQPEADKSKLLKWWTEREDRFDELQQRATDQTATVAEQYQHGRDATVVPGISGHEKKRRSTGNAEQPTDGP